MTRARLILWGVSWATKVVLATLFLSGKTWRDVLREAANELDSVRYQPDEKDRYQ